MSLFIRTSLFLLSLLTTVCSQSCGTVNTNNGCQLVAVPQPGATIYYDPASTANLVFQARTVGTCDSGSVAGVNLYSGVFPSLTLVASCSCLPLDGALHDIVCNPAVRGSLPAGPYEAQFYIASTYYAFNAFTIVHSQVTSTAPTPTSTVTGTVTSTLSILTTITTTDTSTVPQVTTTVPASTSVSTITISPTTVTTTTTIVRTFTKKNIAFTTTKVSRTITAPCTVKTPARCPNRNGHRKRDTYPFALEKRNSYLPVLKKRQSPGGVNGDGPLTVTVTPEPVIVQATSTDTVTEINTVYAATVATLLPTPLTTTIYSGVTTPLTTLTLPTPVKSRTRFSVTHTTVSTTVTFTLSRITRVTPICQ